MWKSIHSCKYYMNFGDKQYDAYYVSLTHAWFKPVARQTQITIIPLNTKIQYPAVVDAPFGIV